MNKVYQITNSQQEYMGSNGSTQMSGQSYGGISGQGIAGTITSTCINPFYGYNNWYYPYYYQTIPQVQKYDIQLRKVENGWILFKDNKEYVINSPEEVIKYLNESK